MKINKLAPITAVLLSLTLSLSLLITSCGNASGSAGGANAPEGTITLNFGGANTGASASYNARAAAPTSDILAELTYTVQLKGAATVTATTKKGEQKLSVSVPAGIYTLTLTARRNGDLYAEGTVNNVKIEAGKTTAVVVQMTLADGSGITIEVFDFKGESIEAFKTWFEAQPVNTPATAYKVKLNVNSLGNIPYSGNHPTSILGNLLETNPTKYVYLDLSGSTFTSIENNAFDSCKNLTGITIPDSVITIEDTVFAYCSNLTSVTIPDIKEIADFT